MNRNIYIFSICAIAFLSCSAPHIRNSISELRFAVTANTAPESPYKTYSGETAKLISALNKENPTFIIHLGNMIYAGNAAGLRDVDIRRQVDEHAAVFSQLSPVCNYTVGELDLFKGSSTAFEELTGKKPFYSFHYGTIHFISLNSSDGAPGTISASQRKWLTEELEYNKNDDAIIVLSYHPLYLQKNMQGNIQTVEKADELHQLFKKYQITAVLSAAGDYYSRTDRDGIAYINTGCIPMYRLPNYDQFRYYSVVLSGGTITVTGKKQ